MRQCRHRQAQQKAPLHKMGTFVIKMAPKFLRITLLGTKKKPSPVSRRRLGGWDGRLSKCGYIRAHLKYPEGLSEPLCCGPLHVASAHRRRLQMMILRFYNPRTFNEIFRSGVHDPYQIRITGNVPAVGTHFAQLGAQRSQLFWLCESSPVTTVL